MKKPDKTFYTLGYTAGQNPYIAYFWNSNIGLTSSGYYIIEVIGNLSNRRYRNNPSFYERMFRLVQAANAYNVVDFISSTNNYYQFELGWSIPGNGMTNPLIYPGLFGFQVLCAVIAPGAFRLYLSGQKIVEVTGTGTTDLSGNCHLFINAASDSGAKNFDVCSFRIWNFASSLPSGWEDEVKRRAMNPWGRSKVFGDSNLKGEWQIDEDNPYDDGTYFWIINKANPGVGNLQLNYTSNYRGLVKIPYRMP
uniref:Uncharacterized protein n=1 Tax=Dictyoglomus turgidum TaxID=513050 RepID=A0A7C3SQQ1_9BACT